MLPMLFYYNKLLKLKYKLKNSCLLMLNNLKKKSLTENKIKIKNNVNKINTKNSSKILYCNL
jgi:hypothetical protein